MFYTFVKNFIYVSFYLLENLKNLIFMAIELKERIKREKAEENTVIQTVNSVQSSRINLANADQRKIIEAISKLARTGYQFVIPIGFPAAGKSLFLSSLFHYAERDTQKRWNSINKSEDPFYFGNISRDTMINFFDRGRAYTQQRGGTLDLIGKVSVGWFKCHTD
jgi:hypothetical protein